MHSREFKLEVLEQIERKQKTTAQVCREHQLSPSLIHRWRKEVESGAVQPGAVTHPLHLMLVQAVKGVGQLAQR
ncbi:transposase [Deinococcus antarcticus]|uniref:Transposase n=1 Tax=Deinococcus antarcticus TaxID=1298767 RepID=A0ABV8AC90_9DEIO